MALRSGRSGHFGRLDVDYDKEADVLYIAIDKPRPADTSDSEHGLLLRRDPDTHQIIGATILHYDRVFKKLPDLSWLKKLALPPELEGYLLERP